MSIWTIAGIVFALAIALYFIGLFRDGRKQRRRIEAFQQDVALRERTYRPTYNEEGHSNEDDTRTWPGPEKMA